ncbi:MAG: T9SS type A sorting domain-containing protein [Bacteroidota bacterium]
MKKSLLICLTMAVGISANAQLEKVGSRLPQGTRVAKMPAHLQSVRVPIQKSFEIMESGGPVANGAARTFTAPVPPAQRRVSNVAIEEAVIGYTGYDLQTNSAVSNRLLRNDDGTMSAVWTFSAQTSTFSDRGTGYNYYNPNDPNLWTNGWFDPITAAGPGLGNIARIEPIRTGFTNIATTASGAEVTLSHSGSFGYTPATIVMQSSRRATKGTGAWTSSRVIDTAATGLYSGLWGKMVADGDTVHAIWRGSDVDVSGAGSSGIPRGGQNGQLMYGRSIDGGASWSPLSYVNPLLDSTYNFGYGGDGYGIDARNGTIAIAYGGSFNDCGIIKSTDGGQTWVRKVAQTFPIPFCDDCLTDMNNDGVVDTADTDGDGLADDIVLTNGEDQKVLIDNNGMCHLFWSAMRITNDDSTDDSYSYYPYTDAIFYWNETMATDSFVIIAQSPDMNGDGELNLPSGSNANNPCNLLTGYYGGTGISGMPSAGIDANGTMYVAFQSVCEGCDTTTYTVDANQARRHVYLIYSADGGNTWSSPEDIVPTSAQGGAGETQEAVFATIARKVDNNIYVLYQRDTQPGNSLYTAGSCDQINNAGAGTSDIVLAKVPTNSLVGINNPSKADFTVSQNYPNPASAYTNIDITMEKAGSVTLNITDILGKTIYSENFNNFSAGRNTITVNTQNFASGLYNYSIITKDAKVTNQMIVR